VQQQSYGSPWTVLRCAITLARLGLCGVDRENGGACLENAVAALPKCGHEPRMRLAQQLLMNYATA
jgi:hypothetical protein